MFVTLTEVVENTTTTAVNGGNRYTLREVTINPEYVVCVREDAGMQRALNEGRLPSELSETHQFTRVYLDRGQSGIDLVVVGEPHVIEAKLIPNTRELLNG